jgi:hypothetical protein
MLEEYEQKGIALARELEEAGVFRTLAENRSNKSQTQLESDDAAAYEELTGITLRTSPTHEKEEEAAPQKDQSWREKEPEADHKKKN